ncbi:TPA: SGNH/GDSL hydrolase family protein [Legionella pneumophila]|nr:SGNH/GDSL hydrolase family protein [Legionella pneumophila]HAT1862478.1 SGNH/GDSL hydrolase family protein [Legionella pneumophila]
MNKSKIYRKYLLKRLMLTSFLFVLVFIPIELFSRWVAVTSIAPFGSWFNRDQKFLIADTIYGGIVGIGDSIIARNFYPELFSSSLAEKLSIAYPTYNLGLEGGNLEEQLALYKYLLKRKVNPKLVIIDVPVHILNVDNFSMPTPASKTPLKLWDDNVSDYYTRCEIKDTHAISTKIYCKLASKFYFLRLLNFYHQQINNSDKTLLHTSKSRLTNLIYNHQPVSVVGFSPIFNVMTSESANSDYLYNAMVKTYERDYIHYQLGTDRLESFIDEFNNHHTKVVLVLMPLYQPLMRKVHDKLHVPENRLIVEKIKQFAEKKKIAFVNLFEELQDPENFQDPVHMNVLGASKITKLLANKILNKDYTYPEGYLDAEIYDYMKKPHEDKS